MVQRRLPDRCPHGDAARPYPVRPMPGWPLGENRDLDEALAQSESALTDCKVALTNSILELSSKDVSNALRSVPFGQRQAVLKPLGLMLKPRQITQSLCQDLRHRIRRVDEHAALRPGMRRRLGLQAHGSTCGAVGVRRRARRHIVATGPV